MVNRYVKINLKKRIIIAHAAQPNVYISVLALLSLSILRLWLRPFLSCSVFFTFALRLRGLQRFILIKNGAKRRRNHLGDFSTRSNKIFPYRSFELLTLSILLIWSPFLSNWVFLRTFLSLFKRSRRMHFDQRWSEKKLDHLSLRPDDRCHFELCWNLRVLRWKFRPYC